MGLTISTPAATFPITLDDAKVHLRIVDSAEDVYLETLLDVATEYAQDTTGRQLVDATYAHTLDWFPAEIRLPRPPLDSVTSITYKDSSNVTQTLASSVYTVIADDLNEGRVVEAINQTWPATADVPNAVTITYVAGYGAAADVPATFKQAILLMLADLFEHRESVVTGLAVNRIPSLEALLWQKKLLTVV